MSKVTVDDVLDSVESWSVLDLNKLVKGIEEKFGVSAAAMAPVSSATAAGGAAAGVASDEKATYRPKAEMAGSPLGPLAGSSVDETDAVSVNPNPT
jgi:ribosomal protein L7/L12